MNGVSAPFARQSLMPLAETVARCALRATCCMIYVVACREADFNIVRAVSQCP